MCGIAGIYDPLKRHTSDGLQSTVEIMTTALQHRGPDGEGFFVDPQSGIALGHRRLAIVDLSPNGAQPMVSSCGRFVISFNGEIYNHVEIARDLPSGGAYLRGRSDTEVLLEACSLFGIEETVSRAIGMFAFAFWDNKHRLLTLVRDRLGIKPLYWGRIGDAVVFGSELKAIAKHPRFRREICRNALAAYFQKGYVASPNSIYKDTFQLPPGSLLRIAEDGFVSQSRYWDLGKVALSAREMPLITDPQEGMDRLESMLRTAVHDRLMGDVPLGAFLSGGIDSTSVVATMTRCSTTPVKTFTIAFEDPNYNEANHAREIAHYLGTEHTELNVTAADALSVIPSLARFFDEPFADASAIPTYLLSALTRQHVTVALSGDGGDELFAGYDRYRVAGLARMGFLPNGLRRSIGATLEANSSIPWDALTAFLPTTWRMPYCGDKIKKLARVLQARSDEEIYQAVTRLWPSGAELVQGADDSPECGHLDTLPQGLSDYLSQMQFADTVSYLPDDILTKVDRASMAVGLEARVPILDHRLVEFSWQLAPNLKRRRGKSKWLLRQLLYKHVPRRLIERPKKGFGVPVGAWIRGPLRDWAESLINPGRLNADGLLNQDLVARMWEEHQSGRRNWAYRLWAVLMFQSWRDEWVI